MLVKKYLRNLSILPFSDGFLMITNLILVQQITTKFGPGLFGDISILISTVGISNVILDFGFTKYQIREIAKPNGAKIKFLYKIQFLSLFFVIIINLVISVIWLNSTLDHLFIYALVIIGQVSYQMLKLREIPLNGRFKYHEIAYGRFIHGFVLIIVILFSLLLEQNILLLCGNLFGGIFSLIVHKWFISPYSIKSIIKEPVSSKELLLTIQRTKYFWINYSLVTVYTGMDLVIAKFFVSDKVLIGNYSLALRMVHALNYAPHLLNIFLYPYLSNKLNDEGSHDEKLRMNAIIFAILLMVALMTGFASIYLYQFFLPLIFGLNYLPSIPIFNVLIWIIPVLIISVLPGRGLEAIDKQNILFITTLITIPLYLLLLTSPINGEGVMRIARAKLEAEIFSSIIIIGFYIYYQMKKEYT